MTNNKLNIFSRKAQQLITNQLIQYNQEQLYKGNNQQTIDRKTEQFIDFMSYSYQIEELTKENVSQKLFSYVYNGSYGKVNIPINTGTKQYRKSIYSNIREILNFIFLSTNGKEIIPPLTQEQNDLLDDVNINNWFRVDDARTTHNMQDSIQVELIKQLGIKVYFDEDNQPYVLSHELAELIGKENKDVMKAIRKLNSEIDALKNELVEKSDGSKNSPIENRSNFTMKQDVYRITKKKGDKVIGMESRDTYRIYKDLLLMYVLGLNGSKYIEFKMKYISAFNYIEQQYMNYMAERIKIKDGFLKIYNDLRAENAKLLLNKGI